MRLVGEILLGVLLLVLVVAMLGTLGAKTDVDGIKNLGLMNDKLCFLVAEATGILVCAILLSAESLSRRLGQPSDRVTKERPRAENTRPRVTNDADRLAALRAREEREMDSAVELQRIMTPAKPTKTAEPAADFDAVIAGELTPAAKAKIAAPPMRNRTR